jgi:DNA-binding NarL/FixJ family response regulator
MKQSSAAAHPAPSMIRGEVAPVEAPTHHAAGSRAARAVHCWPAQWIRARQEASVSEPRVLIIDGEPDMVDNCARILRPRAGPAESERPDLVLTDLNMPEIDGLAVLRRARKLDPALPVVVITAFATIESAVAAIKDRAFNCLPKNFSVGQLTLLVARALYGSRSRTATCAISCRPRSTATRTTSRRRQVAGIDRKTFHRPVTKHRIRS